MDANHMRQVQLWLDEHSEYRLANLDDCDCADSVQLLRNGNGEAWKPQPNYQPYYVIADFDNDGAKDFAVIVRRLFGEEKALVLIFLNRKINQKKVHPIVFRVKEKSIVGIGLFLSRTKPTKLLIGAFSSEAEVIPVSEKNGHRANH